MDKSKKIEIYSTTQCPYCVLAKRYFDSLGLEYTDYNVGDDMSKAMEMFQRTGGEQGVPMIFINDVLVKGFNKPQIDSLLGEETIKKAA